MPSNTSTTPPITITRALASPALLSGVSSTSVLHKSADPSITMTRPAAKVISPRISKAHCIHLVRMELLRNKDCDKLLIGVQSLCCSYVTVVGWYTGPLAGIVVFECFKRYPVFVRLSYFLVESWLYENLYTRRNELPNVMTTFAD